MGADFEGGGGISSTSLLIVGRVCLDIDARLAEKAIGELGADDLFDHALTTGACRL